MSALPTFVHFEPGDSAAQADAADLLDDRCVYVRTAHGQQCAAANAGLNETERCLLLMFNGQTQLGILTDMLPAGSDAAQSVMNLHAWGLIELLGPAINQDTAFQVSSWPGLVDSSSLRGMDAVSRLTRPAPLPHA